MHNKLILIIILFALLILRYFHTIVVPDNKLSALMSEQQEFAMLLELLNDL